MSDETLTVANDESLVGGNITVDLERSWWWRVREERPLLLHLGLFVGAYVFGAGVAQMLAIVPGTGISIWPPSGLFIATLVYASRYSWPWWVLGGCLAEMVSNALWFHSPVPAAFLIYFGNALEAVIGAWLVRWACGRPVRLETLREVVALVILGAGVAPVASATVGSATLAWFGIKSQTFAAAWPLFWLGDATGVLIVAPLALVVFQNWRGRSRLSAARWIEACVLALIFLGVAALSLSGHLASAYVVMPPLLWAAVRFEFKGAAVALTLLALITVVFTMSGASQFVGQPDSQRQMQVELQLFLAISAFSVLIVAAISRQHQQALLTLGESERDLSQLVDMVPSHVWRLTPDGEPAFFNKRMAEFLGLDVEDTVRPGMTRLEVLTEAVHPDDAAPFRGALAHSLTTSESFVMRYRLRRHDGVYRWMSSRAEPMRDQNGRILHWYGLCHDIDDQVYAEEAVRRRERDLRDLVDVVPVAIACLAPDGEPRFFNQGMTDLLGLDLTDLDGAGETSRRAAVIAAAVHPDDTAEFTEAFNHSLGTGEPLARKYRLRHASGEYRWVDNRIEPLRDQEGAVLQWYGVCIDIDEQMRLYSDVEEREAKIRRLVDSDIIGIVIWDLDGRVIDANDAFLDMIQYDRADLAAGIRWFDVTPPEWQAVHAHEEAEELARTGKMQTREKEYFRKDGSRVPVLIGAACFEGNSRQGVAYILDLTERKRAEAAQLSAEEALRQASDELAKATQAASLAELSASIAHEVNQPLAAIVANSHACHRWLSAEPPNIERAKITAERIIRDATSAGEVVSRIRALFRQSTETRSSTALGNAVAEAMDLMAEEAARCRVRIDTEIEPNLPPVALDRVQVQQVLINLMRNGIEAMKGTADARVLGLSARRRGDAVQTEISDRGRGVEHPGRIFDPFVTTKPQGMGMGLAICRSIVESHGGRLWTERNEPQGAKFIFTLPVEVKSAE